MVVRRQGSAGSLGCQTVTTHSFGIFGPAASVCNQRVWPCDSLDCLVYCCRTAPSKLLVVLTGALEALKGPG